MKHLYSPIETLIRYFSIIKYRKILYIKYFFQATLRGFSIMIHIVFLQKITFFLENGDKQGFENILIIYIASILIYEFLWFLTRNWGWVETIPHSRTDILREYLGKYIRLDNTAVEKIGTGKLIGIIHTGAYRWVDSLASVIDRGLELIVAIIFSCYLLAQYNSIYILYFIIFLLIFLGITASINQYLFKFRSERYELRNTLISRLTKILMSKNEVLQSNRFSSEVKEMSKVGYGLSTINKRMSNGRMGLKRIMPFFMNGVLVFIFFTYGLKVFSGEIALSQLVGITGAMIIIQGVLTNFLNFYVDLTKDFIEIHKLWDFFDSTPEIKGYDLGKELVYKEGNIEVKNISFSYNKRVKVFNTFNVHIEGGKITAFVGNSGSGKSTLIKIIAGYIQADTGNILIDGQKISTISLKSYYKSIGYLTQEPSVFDGSIYDNLTYALEEIPTPEKLNEIIVLSKCEFIYDLEYGLETEIGERGVRLSGGQRQRLAIAKIFLKNPKIIILDEPTSALDSFSEEQITTAMHNLFKNRTVIIIAHRLQTVKHAHSIMVLEKGEVIEEGTHKSLISQKGVYARMLELQSGF